MIESIRAMGPIEAWAYLIVGVGLNVGIIGFTIYLAYLAYRKDE